MTSAFFSVDEQVRKNGITDRMALPSNLIGSSGSPPP